MTMQIIYFVLTVVELLKIVVCRILWNDANFNNYEIVTC